MTLPCPPPMTPAERVSRALVFSTFVQTDEHNNRIVQPEAFAPPSGSRAVSVHRLEHVSSDRDKVRLARDVALRRRRDPSKFYGWAELAVSRVEMKGWQVVATPQPENMYHADIILPERRADDRRALHRQLTWLATNPTFRNIPEQG